MLGNCYQGKRHEERQLLFQRKAKLETFADDGSGKQGGDNGDKSVDGSASVVGLDGIDLSSLREENRSKGTEPKKKGKEKVGR